MRIRLAVVLQRQTQEMRNILPIHATNERIRSVDTCRNSTGRDNIAVFDPSRSWYPVYVGTGRCSPGPGSLIRSCLAAVKNACAREECGAGADGDDVFELWGSLLVIGRMVRGRVNTFGYVALTKLISSVMSLRVPPPPGTNRTSIAPLSVVEAMSPPPFSFCLFFFQLVAFTSTRPS